MKLRGETEEYRGVGHGVPHKPWQEFVGVHHRQLSPIPCRFHIHALSFEAWANGIPVGKRWHQYDALSVRDSGTGEPTDGAIEKVLVLIELHDVIARRGICKKSIPRFTSLYAVHFTVELTLHDNCLRCERNLSGSLHEFSATRTSIRNCGNPRHHVSAKALRVPHPVRTIILLNFFAFIRIARR